MKLIGITGPTGAGKTTALNELTARGAELIDCDALYHELLANSQELNAELYARFPDAYSDSVLDRKKLGSIVFADKAALADLNRITVTHINREIERRIAEAEAKGLPAVGVDAINLIGSGIEPRCDCTVAIIAPNEVRVKRIMARDGIGEEYARSRIAAQQPNEYFSSHCTFTLNNCGTAEEFAGKARALFAYIIDG